MPHPQFHDHEVVQKSPDDYIERIVGIQTVLGSWQLSLFAHELLDKNGRVKAESQMNEATLERFLKAQDSLKRGESLAKPVIGIGIMDNLEIGIGREIVAAASVMGLAEIPVTMRKAQAKDIEKLLKQ